MQEQLLLALGKLSDKGDNWNLNNTEIYLLNGVYAIEIDFTNPEIIYISGNGGFINHMIVVNLEYNWGCYIYKPFPLNKGHKTKTI